MHRKGREFAFVKRGHSLPIHQLAVLHRRPALLPRTPKGDPVSSLNLPHDGRPRNQLSRSRTRSPKAPNPRRHRGHAPRKRRASHPQRGFFVRGGTHLGHLHAVVRPTTAAARRQSQRPRSAKGRSDERQTKHRHQHHGKQTPHVKTAYRTTREEVAKNRGTSWSLVSWPEPCQPFTEHPCWSSSQPQTVN